MRNLHTEGARMIQFTAETKCSGINLSDGTEIRKGAFDTIRKMTEEAGNPFPKEAEEIIDKVAGNGVLLLSSASTERLSALLNCRILSSRA